MINISSEAPKILVVGSCSLDLVLYTDTIPLANETILVNSSEYFFGGKGANQAVGTARLGAHVYFLGCVGMDPLGQQVMRNFVDESVNIALLSESETSSTGTAYVTSAVGDAAIVVIPAANYDVNETMITEAEKYFSSVDMVLLQMEIPESAIVAAINLAKKHNKKVGLYASPGRLLSKEVTNKVDFIFVKSKELSTVFGPTTIDQLLQEYPNKIFLRDHINSTLYFDGKEMKYHRVEDDSMIHKMGMGDAFISGFSVALCHGNSLEDAVKFGAWVSSKVALEKGSQVGLPRWSDVETVL